MAYGFLKGVAVWQLLNLQSIIIVFGGLLTVLFLGFSWELIAESYRNTINAIKKPHDQDYETHLLRDILHLARIYRTHGPFALEKETPKIDHDFLKYGAILVAEGYDELALMSALEREHITLEKKAHSQVQLIRTLARLAPALGMAGTVISLMQVMQHLGSQESLGMSMSLALSSTLYGIVLANLFFLPISLKLQQYLERESMARIMLMDALMGLQQAEHPLRIAERLNSYELYCNIKNEENRGAATVSIAGKKAVTA